MLIKIRVLFLLCIAIVSGSSLRAQSMDYMRHNKTFYLCDYKLDCSGCYGCDQQKFTARIKNRVEKKIKKVYYVYFSVPRNRLVTEEAVIVGNVIDYDQIGLLHLCLPNGLHWAISEIVYEDDTKASFVVKDRLDTFVQEADECDCNKRTVLPNPNIK